VVNLDEVVRACRDHEIASLVVDVEPVVATWDTDAEHLARGVARIQAVVFGSVPSLRRLAFATNSARRLADPTVSYRFRARKPWSVGWVRILPPPVAIVGDTVLTDGLLAHGRAAESTDADRNGR
jgi:hypothetical protein